MTVKNARAQLRQKVIDYWFQKFVDNELYDKEDYHRFCKRVKDKTELEIERIYRTESWIVGK